MTWTVLQLIQWSEEFLHGKGVASPRLDVELLLARTLGLTRVQLYVQFDRPLQEGELGEFKTLLKRRATREPLAYILGEKEFFSLKFQVGPAVLIPRPETEELVERGLAHLQGLAGSGVPPRILDLATGSGCILISLLKALPQASGVGLDSSASALEGAAGNAVLHAVRDRMQCLHQDLSLEWICRVPGPWDLITANLPYVSEAEFQGLEPEIREFEPRAALVPGDQGTEAFSWVLPHLSGLLASRGLAFFEIGSGQADALKEMARAYLRSDQVEFERDLAGKERIMKIRP